MERGVTSVPLAITSQELCVHLCTSLMSAASCSEDCTVAASSPSLQGLSRTQATVQATLRAIAGVRHCVAHNHRQAGTQYLQGTQSRELRQAHKPGLWTASGVLSCHMSLQKTDSSLAADSDMECSCVAICVREGRTLPDLVKVSANVKG